MPFSKYSILDNIIEGVQIISPDWQYVYVNETVAQHGKASKEKLIGRTMMEQYPGIEGTEMFKFLQDCMSKGVPHQMINEFDFHDGSKGYFELRMQRVEEGVLILSFDVTKQKQLEQWLQNTNALLDEKVNQRTVELTIKNSELEQFAYIASHDLQEPLRTVSNYIQILKEDCAEQLDAPALKYLDTIQVATKRMSNLLRSLLEFSRLGRNTAIQQVDFKRMISDVNADLENLINTTGAVINVGPMPVLNVYEPEMRQLFQNLISNAIKFRKKNVCPEIEISCEQINSKWQFCVKDNGIGIEPKQYKKVFQIFQRLHSGKEYEGDGIGLANCKKIVELHDGKIWIDSAIGRGSSFNFTISKF